MGSVLLGKDGNFRFLKLKKPLNSPLGKGEDKVKNLQFFSEERVIKNHP